MSKQLTTQNASITTVAVEVQALTISGKQVTLSVFRQLQEEKLVAHDGTLNGVPWGYVNYHPDKCSETAAHWHVVWQSGADLRRSRVIREPRWKLLDSPEADQLIGTSVLSWATDPDSPFKYCPLQRANTDNNAPRFEAVRRWTHPTTVEFLVEASQCALKVAALAAQIRSYRETFAKDGRTFFRDQAERIESGDEYRIATAQLINEVEGYGRTLSELKEDVNAVAIAEVQRRDRHRMVRGALAQLPQLFIAV
ncbi:hypothetical protein R6V09_12445 [Streptomyces sp. W16]|uniref:hypothetical protein n=1 Tax=Streptomyces sp. W16 TaxID=3076631 RepID=UPI00295B3B04|nr:hypothetical protein [Streptomyces sp. W16]MDV9170941.1 hypothetical protein [Streptomyces sp. W16]